MCMEKKTVGNVNGQCRGRCADLSQTDAAEAEILEQKQKCHGSVVPAEESDCGCKE